MTAMVHSVKREGTLIINLIFKHELSLFIAQDVKN